jgi:RNAse (barnase) inhibitor barstar
MSSQINKQVQKLMKKGGELELPAELHDVSQALVQADIAWCVADCDRARNRSALFRAIVKAVDYPQFFGSSFEGLYDCLCDSVSDQKVGLALVLDNLHSADPTLQGDMAELGQVLSDVVAQASDNSKVFIFAIRHVGRHADDAPGVVHNWSDATD